MKLITTVNHDPTLLPYFLNHYSQLGVEHFLIGVYAAAGSMNRIHRLCSSYSCFVTLIAGDFNGNKDIDFRRSVCRNFVGNEEWWVVADLDEFHEYPSPLNELSQRLERSGYSYLQSQFLDRIAVDGSSPTINRRAGLWEQFPAGAFLTRDLLQAIPTKLMLVRGHSPIGAGHHRPGPDAQGFVRKGGVVHHFKWFGDIAGKMEARRNSFMQPDSRQYRKCDNLLKYWQAHGRLPIAGEFGFHFPQKPEDWPDLPRPRRGEA